MTLRALVSLIEDLFQEGYNYVLTARFQIDPLERRFSRYRQMNGGNFLVSLREVCNSEKILLIQGLVRETRLLERCGHCFQSSRLPNEWFFPKRNWRNIQWSSCIKIIGKHSGSKLLHCWIHSASYSEDGQMHECSQKVLAENPTSVYKCYLDSLSRGGLKKLRGGYWISFVPIHVWFLHDH